MGWIDLKPIGNYNFKRHMKPILIFFAMSCATTIYTNLDTVMLGFMSTDVDVGYYNAAVKIKVILVSIVTSLGTVLLIMMIQLCYGIVKVLSGHIMILQMLVVDMLL